MPLLVGAVAALSRDEPSPAREQAAVRAYADGIRPFAREGGRVVTEQIKPRLTDLELGKVTAEQFRQEAAAWKRKMEDVRQGFAGVAPPKRLREAAHLYDRALRQYREAIDAFAAASTRPPAELKDAITAAVPTADAADHTYDRADALVQAELARVHLPTRPTVPGG